jgi:hypothetical protein
MTCGSRRLRAWLAVVLCVAATAALRAAPAAALEDGTAIFAKIDHARAVTWRWQRVMGRRLTPTFYSERRTRDQAYRRRVLAMWQRRAASAHSRALHPPRLGAWLCIHRHEGAWKDPYAPYYGGLQMDISFQAVYGRTLLRRKGTANRWTPLEQIWVAERAYRSGRGFRPWPNTARSCGLL